MNINIKTSCIMTKKQRSVLCFFCGAYGAFGIIRR